MEEIRIWELSKEDNRPSAVPLETIRKTETERLLEEAIVSCPDLLLAGLKLVGRQTDTPGGALDLLGVAGDGSLVVFELKKGTLTRDAVAQVIDYGSYLAELDPEELSTHISERSGKMGIEKIENFLAWYQEEFGTSFSFPQSPRLILVGLGADDRARRMVSFLANSEVDISLITFHAFMKDGRTLLARRVEVEAQRPSPGDRITKQGNLAQLQSRVARLGVSDMYQLMAPFFQKALSAYQWPNPSGFSYYLPELTESGSESNRVFVSLYLYDNRPGEVQVRIHPRAVAAASEFFTSPEAPTENMHRRPDGGVEVWIGSPDEWKKREPFFKKLCSAIVTGWRKGREQQARFDTQPTEVGPENSEEH
ncbi:MAG: DUF91 domain-containing protein [Chloroflexi bacterium]|nr:DUF91 domain-containing protein [Chloroflexota bacterium]